MRITLSIICLFYFKSTFSQTLNPAAEKVKFAFDKLMADSSNKKMQANYIQAFPADTKTFLTVFQTTKFDQLYMDSYKYLELFERCGTNSPKEVIDKCIAIGKNLVWDADAVGQLQKLSVLVAVKNTNIFVDEYKMLDGSNQDNLISFYADVENYSAYKIYQDLIVKLKVLGETDISKKMEDAREKREKRNDH